MRHPQKSTTRLSVLFLVSALSSLLVACDYWGNPRLEISIDRSSLKVGDTATITSYVVKQEIEAPQYSVYVADNRNGFRKLVGWLGGEIQTPSDASQVLAFVDYDARFVKNYGVAVKVRGRSPGTAVLYMTVSALFHDPPDYRNCPIGDGCNGVLESKRIQLTVTAP
jgi:hypothetical protein